MLDFFKQMVERAWSPICNFSEEHAYYLKLLDGVKSFEELQEALYVDCHKDPILYRAKYQEMMRLFRTCNNDEMSRHVSIRSRHAFTIYPITGEVKVCGSDFRFKCDVMDSLMCATHPTSSTTKTEIYKAALNQHEDKVFRFYREPSFVDHIFGFFKEGPHFNRRSKIVAKYESGMRLFKPEDADGYSGLPPTFIRCLIQLSTYNKPHVNNRLVAVARKEIEILFRAGLLHGGDLIRAKELVHDIAVEGYLPKEAYDLIR